MTSGLSTFPVTDHSLHGRFSDHICVIIGLFYRLFLQGRIRVLAAGPQSHERRSNGGLALRMICLRSIERGMLHECYSPVVKPDVPQARTLSFPR
jgi:hypothetical protein